MSFIPDADADFDEWQQNFVKHVVAGPGTWNIPNARITALTNRQTQWKDDYAAGGKHVDRTDSQQLKKTQTRDVYEKEIREFIGEFVRKNSEINDDDRRAMKVTVPDTERTERPVIGSVPHVTLIVQQGASFLVENRVESDSTRASMHEHADGVELCWIVKPVSDSPPASPAECNKSKVVSKARHKLNLDPADAGKRIHLYTRWVNTSDESKNSNWTRLHSAIISD